MMAKPMNFEKVKFVKMSLKKANFYSSILLYFFLTLLPSRIYCQERDYVPTDANLRAREDFQDDKFGLFIHWGVYSLLGDGEWVMQNQDIAIDEYEKLPHAFYPSEFNAKEWVSLAKQAGVNYITITTKHHDGFAMYDSDVSDYNIVDGTPYGMDIFRELEQECIKQGIKLYAYYSQLDWHHPDYYPRGWTGRRTGRPEQGVWEQYLKYQDAQIKEIAENYKISGFWFDGWWDQRWDEKSWWRAVKYRLPENNIDWKLRRTYDMIHEINSALLIGNNHHVEPFAGEDFQMFEKDLPGKNTTGFGSSADEIGNLPLETCQTINGHWGFYLKDRSLKSRRELIHLLATCAGYGANLLLNVGPQPSGKIDSDQQDRLREIGEWLDKNGESIYGTRAGIIPPQQWGVTTRKGEIHYLHILAPQYNMVYLPSLAAGSIESLRYKDSGKSVSYKAEHGGILVTLEANSIDQDDTILIMTLKNE